MLTTGHPLAITDLSAEGHAQDPRLLAAAARGVVLCPLRFFNQPFGRCGVLTTKPREFRKRETLLVEAAAHFITTTIAHHRAEQALAAEREYSDLLLSTFDALAVVVTPAGRVVRLNTAAQRITGFSSAEIRDRPIFSALLVAEEVDLFETALASLTKGGKPQKLEGWVLTKLGDRRRIAWSCAPYATAGAKPTILCTGIDVTRFGWPMRNWPPFAPPPQASSGRRNNTPGNLKKSAAKSPGWKSTPWSDGGPPAFMQIGDNSRNERRSAEPTVPLCAVAGPGYRQSATGAKRVRKGPLPRHFFRRLLLLRAKIAKDQTGRGRLRRCRLADVSGRRNRALPTCRRQANVSGRLPLHRACRLLIAHRRRCDF